MEKSTKARIVVNILLAAMVMLGCVFMIFGGNGTLLSNGLDGLKYFTVLSNIFEGFAALMWLSPAARSEGGRRRRFCAVLKYAACVCVFLTFSTVMLFLGPMFGYLHMFDGANFWFHLIIPLTSVAEFAFFNDVKLTWRENLAVILPVLIYGGAYLANILLNGVGEYPDTNDWYGFAMWGIPVGVAIFGVICLFACLLGLILRVLNKAAGRSVYRLL